MVLYYFEKKKKAILLGMITIWNGYPDIGLFLRQPAFLRSIRRRGTCHSVIGRIAYIGQAVRYKGIRLF